MQTTISHLLQRPFPSFLACRKGCIYYSWLIIIMMIIANILQPFGLINWHEFHKPLVMCMYIAVFFVSYALLYSTLSYFRAINYKPDNWTTKKQLLLLLLFIPITACSTFLFVYFTVPEFEFSLSSFLQLQLYNITLSALSIPTFGFFIDKRLNSNSLALRNWKRQRVGKMMNELQAGEILLMLHQAMETQQLYLSPKCSLQFVSDKTGTPYYLISEAVNSYSGYSYTDFVNKYRVEHACRVLQDGKNKRLKLEAVGLESGFGCKVNFYAAFRKFTGKTPAEYLAEVKIPKADK